MAPKIKRILTGPWSQLPVDVLDNIIKRLNSPVDVVAFSGVCKPWRYVALGIHMPLSCKLQMHHLVPKWSPLPMLLHPGCEGPDTHQLYSINEQKICGPFHLPELSNKWIVGSGAGWLVTVDTSDPKVNLLNPLTGKQIPLPHLSTLPRCKPRADGDDRTAYWYLRKVILCSYRGTLLVVALVSGCKTIRFCRIGDSKWSKVVNSPLYIQDIVMHNGKLYAINFFGALFVIDIAKPGKVTMVAMSYYRPDGKCFLVDLCGELVLLDRRLSRLSRATGNAELTSRFSAYKLVEDQSGYVEEYESETGTQYPEKVSHSWVPLKNLGHHMVFIGYNYSFSLDSRVYPRCKGNCIYFADCGYDEYDFWKMRGMRKKFDHDVGVCHMGKQKNRKLEDFKNFSSASSPMNMVWLSPNLSSELQMQMIPQ